MDNANVHIEGTSEVAVGQAIKGYDRAGLYLATKIQVNTEEEAGRLRTGGGWRRACAALIRPTWILPSSTGCGGAHLSLWCRAAAWPWTRLARPKQRV